MTIIPDRRAVAVTFLYSIMGVPKRCRIEREVFSFGETSAVMHVARPEDTQVAFRVGYPTDNPLRYVYPRTPLSDDGYQTEARIEIIKHDGKFWWPIRSGGKSRYGVLSLQQVLEQLEFLHVDILNMIPLKLPKLEGRPPRMRSVSEDRSGQAEAAAQRAVFENFLICGDRVYARGGEPMYTMVTHGRSRTWEMAVVDPGFNRRIKPDRIGEIRDPFRIHWEWWVQDAYRSGRLWRADMRELVADLAHRMQSEIPTIEIIGSDPPAEDSERIVTDALFRRAVALVDHFCQEPDALLSKASEMQSTDQATSAIRRHAMREFFHTPREVHEWKPMKRLHEQFRRCEHQMGPEPLAPEDEEAIRALAP